MIVSRCIIPESAISVRAVRSSGPGGQNVNKVASKVELRVDLDAIVGLDPAARARLLALCRNDLDSAGRLLVTSQLTRDQRRNIDDARAKVHALVARALERPTVRRKTKPTRGSVERRIEWKKQRGRVKAMRRNRED
jgi:ribosome-associated protein